MLRQLQIRNFAIIDHLALEFDPGMTVFSGETGAGKSILIDALGMLLGDRADNDTVRDGAERAEIDAQFDIADAPQARRWLRDHDLEDPDEPDTAVVRRLLSREGRSRAYINGRAATARDLKELGERLVDIHGQHAHQSLMRAQTQIDQLDAYGVPAEIRDAVAATAEEHRALRERFEHLSGGADAEHRADFLRYQVQELEALNLDSDEVEELEAEQRRLANAEQLMHDSQQAYALLYENEDGAVADLLGQAKTLLGNLVALDSSFREAADMVGDATIQVHEAADALRHASDAMDLDPQRLEWVENRLSDIFALARKHRVQPVELPAHLDKLRAELEELEGAADELVHLQRQLSDLQSRYADQADRLSEQRRGAAERLAAEVTEAVRALGMPEGRFEILVQRRNELQPRARGQDHVEFRISANPGQAPQPLSKVASGGELSRISLAVEVIAAGDRVPTLIFDEVDTGIGGGVAEMVGLRLKALGANGQVMCVTHLPQVAAQGIHHFQVRKEAQEDRTVTRITSLDETGRVEELARMLGGLKITSQTRAHAREMLGNSS